MLFRLFGANSTKVGKRPLVYLLGDLFQSECLTMPSSRPLVLGAALVYRGRLPSLCIVLFGLSILV